MKGHHNGESLGRSAVLTSLIGCALLIGVQAGCAATYHDYLRDAQHALRNHEYSRARHFLTVCDRRQPRRWEVLHDLGVCNLAIAVQKFEQINQPAAYRELDQAVFYFNSALEVRPGYHPSLVGLNAALEMRGDTEEALAKAKWAAENIGPGAKQYMFLASEFEERGDMDEALRAYKQAVSIEPKSAEANAALARFLLRVPNEPEAVQYLLAAYRLNPSDQWVRAELDARGQLPPEPAVRISR